MKRKDYNNNIHHLSVSDRDVTPHRDIANTLADNISRNSSSTFFTSVGHKA